MSARNANSIDAIVGRNVRIRRLAKGLSQSQLGRRLGVTFQQVQKYEKGSNRMGSGRLVRIAEILEVPVSALFDGVDGPSDRLSSVGPSLLPDRRSLRLAQAFDGIEDPLTRLSIIGLVERVAAAVPGRRRRRK